MTMSAAQIFGEVLPKRLAEHPKLVEDVCARLRIDVADAGQWDIDLRHAPGKIARAQGPCDCTISLDAPSLVAIVEGRASPHTLFMRGKLKVGGDVHAALRLGVLFA